MSRSVSILDRMISHVAPGLALKREVAKQRLEFLNSGYSHHGANTSKKSMLDWDSESRSPKEDINDNLSLLRQRSRDLYMGGANIATGAVRTKRTNVVGSGLVLKPSIDSDFLKMSDEEADEWKRTVLREFEFYASSINCDSLRLNNFYELQQLAFISKLVSGDTFALLPYKKRAGFPYDLRIQLLEADRIGTPAEKLGDARISQGVEVKNGEITAYYIFNQHPGASNFDYTYKRVEAFGAQTGRCNIIHIMEAERPEQTRGIPVLAPVIESLRQLGKYTNAELTAAVVGGLFSVFVQSLTPEAGMGEAISEQDKITDDDYSYELGYGSIVHLDKDEDIKIAAPGRPNTAFDGFVNAILRQIGAALEIPYELLIKHFSASYSASRAAILEAWKMFRMSRKGFADDFCQPIYEEWLSEAVAKGRVYAPGFFDDPIIKAAYCKAEWHGPSPGQIDPLKEVNAAVIRIREELSTREREAAELTGTDYTVNHRQRIREEIMHNELLDLSNAIQSNLAAKGGETQNEE